MKKIRRLLILLMTLIMCMQPILSLNTYAATKKDYYQTSKNDVPIWSQSNSKSKKIKTIAKKGTVLIVVDSTVNSSNNKWYKLKDGNWVYSGNVTKHTHSYSSNSGGYCTAEGCDYEFQLTLQVFEAKKYIVTNKDGAQIWSRPYSGNSSKVRVAKKGSSLMINAKATNERNNLWYRLEDGNWVYSGNVQPKYAEPDVEVHKETDAERINKTMTLKNYQGQCCRKDPETGKEVGICDTCSTMNLLNRRLAMEGKFQSEQFTIERTLCIVRGQDPNKKPKSDKCSKHSDRKIYTCPGGEKWSGNKSIDFTTTAGTEYTLKVLKNKEIESNVTDQLVSLLDKHPEGIVIHCKVPKTGEVEEKQHAVLLTRYEKNNGKTSFYCIDPVKVLTQKKLEIPLEEAWNFSTYKYSESTYMDRIMYLA